MGPKTSKMPHGRKPVRANVTVEALDQEIAWRTWFPTVPHADWTQDLDPGVAQVYLDACVAFCEANLFIRVPGKGRIPLVLRDAQKEVLRAWITHRRTVSLKARQIGFSTLAAAYALWATFGYSDRLVVMLSKGERESIKLLLKTKYMYKYMPQWVADRGPKLLDKVKQIMTFDNDSSIESLPSANDPARGESVFTVIIDEWAFLPNPEEAWASVEPVTDIGGRVIGISTAKGEGNFFHRLWLGSQTRSNTFTGIFFPWNAVENRTPEWRLEKARDLEPWQLAQEYPGSPEEAFVGSGNPVFNLENLRRFDVEEPVIEYTINTTEKGRFNLWPGGPLQVWEPPDAKRKHAYVIGADIAQGLEHGDLTVAWVIDVQENRPVAVWYGRIDPDIFGETVLPAIGWYYRNAVIAPEINNHGLTVLKGLQRAGYTRIYRRWTWTKRRDQRLESIGWLTTSSTKPVLIDELAKFLRETENIPHDITQAELRSFTRDEKGKMSGSPHDDCVMALAIAVECRKYAINEHLDQEIDPRKVKGSYAWFKARLDKSGGGDRSVIR